MTITVYTNYSEPNVVDKQLVQGQTLTGTLRDSSSVISPTVRIEADSSILNVNYLWIEEFHRFYFVGDIVSVVNNIWDLYCHVDVLSTYKTQIRKLSAVLARQENIYNLYLEDDRLLTTSRRIYWTKAFPNRVNSARDNPDGVSFIFTCAGGAETQEPTA